MKATPEQIAALHRLRELHRGMGLPEEQCAQAEEALRSGEVAGVEIRVPAGEGERAA